ncbi:MAG: pyridoxal phosphate-dependent aminotransferase [Saprospiraceae bacterium]
MKTTAQHMLSTRVALMSESATLRMSKKARQLKAQGHDVISLSLGEPDFDTSQHIKDAASEALKNGYTKYTPVSGLPDLVDAIKIKFARDNDLHFESNQIVVSNGAKQCIANICLSILNPGDEIILFTPYWVSYFDIVSFAGGTPIKLSAGIKSDFKVTPDMLEKAINHKTKAILFSSPCNPTGSVYTRSELEGLAEVISKHKNIVVISDEIYEYINFTGQHASIGAIQSMRDRTVTVNGMSKGFAMTGWRLGYMGGPQWLMAACTKVQGQFTSGAASFSQKAAAHALLADLDETYDMREAFLQRRDKIIGWLQEIPGFNVNHPTGAFYIFPDISSYFGKTNGSVVIDDSNDFAELLLEGAHVATVAGSAFGNDKCIRISYAASEDQLKEATRRIAECLKEFS